MKKVAILMAAAACLALTACEDHTDSAKSYPFTAMPEGLEDCKMFELDTRFKTLIVTRCPNSTASTHYTNGKASVTTIVVDGVMYIPAAEPGRGKRKDFDTVTVETTPEGQDGLPKIVKKTILVDGVTYMAVTK